MTGSVNRLIPYLASTTNNTGIAVIICPGGSYSWLCRKREGKDVAKWLQSNGINAYVLHYRVATLAAYILGFRVFGLGHTYPDMLIDMDQALEYVYQNAANHHINPRHIGVLGFSAGGHLAMASQVLSHTPHKPSFIGVLYPVVSMVDPVVTHKRSRRGALGVWGQWDKQKQEEITLENKSYENCPPVFIANCKDDPVVPYQNSEVLDQTLSRFHVPHVYYQYHIGGHGFGASKKKGSSECHQWKNTFLQWLLAQTKN